MNYIICKNSCPKYILRILLLFIIFSIIPAKTSAQRVPAQTIPDFTFYKLNGQPFSRKNLTKSKKLVIVFFDVTCDHCQKELKAISEKIERFKKVEIYLVSMDNVQGIENFMKKYAPEMRGRANVTLLTDLNRQFIERFAPIQFPATYIYGSNWRLIKYFGQNSKVADIVSTVDR